MLTPMPLSTFLAVLFVTIIGVVTIEEYFKDNGKNEGGKYV